MLVKINIIADIDNYDEAHKITNKIYLGSIYPLIQNDCYLKKVGITHILSCCSDAKNMTPDYNQMLIDIIDSEGVNIIQHFKKAIYYIEQGDIVYVHCIAGISRSSSFVIAYLMWKDHLSYEEASDKVQSCRPCINPNPGFISQLKLFEKHLTINDYSLDKIVL